VNERNLSLRLPFALTFLNAVALRRCKIVFGLMQNSFVMLKALNDNEEAFDQCFS
jgi:hypothetical protein